MHFTGTYQAKATPRHRGDYTLQLRSLCGSVTHTIDGADVPRGTSLREAALEWTRAERHTLEIDWSSLTFEKP